MGRRAMLTVDVLGPLVISDGDRFPPLKLSKKAQALLAVLAVAHGRAVTRSKLADLLWPHASEQARHSLRNSLLDIGRTLGSVHDTIGRDFYHCWLLSSTDVSRFEELANSDELHDLKEA